MSNTPPSDPNIVNTQALEGIVRAFDRVIGAKYGLGSVEPQTAATLEETKLREFEIQVVRTVMVREQAVKLEREERSAYQASGTRSQLLKPSFACFILPGSPSQR